MEKNDLIPENNENNIENINEAPAEAVQEENIDSMRRVTDESVDFSAENDIKTVVGAPEAKNNKLPVIIAACVLAIAVIVAGIVMFMGSKNDNTDAADGDSVVDSADSDKNAFDKYLDEALTEEITDTEGNVISRDEYIEDLKQQVQEATTTLNENVGTDSPNQIVENTTQAVSDGAQAQDKELLAKAEIQIKAFFDRSCYIQGAMYSGGEGDPLAMSLDGENFDILTNLDGTEVSIMKIDGTLYIKRPATKQYIELTDTVMEMMGLDASTFDASFGNADYATMQSKLRATYDVSINGTKGVCHEYVNGDQTFKFYSADGQLKQIDTFTSAGEADTQIIINYFSESIPGDQMSLKGYEKSSIGTIFADII